MKNLLVRTQNKPSVLRATLNATGVIKGIMVQIAQHSQCLAKLWCDSISHTDFIKKKSLCSSMQAAQYTASLLDFANQITVQN